jgi:hypothetical protein
MPDDHGTVAGPDGEAAEEQEETSGDDKRPYPYPWMA